MTLLADTQALTGLIANKIVLPLMIFFLSVVIGKIVKNTLLTFGKAIELDKHSRRFLKGPINELLAGGIAAIIYTVGVVWALRTAGILVIGVYVVIGFLGIVLLVGLLVWLSDFLPNFYGYLRIRKRVKIGKSASLAGLKGVVVKKGLLRVEVEDDGNRYAFPNASLANSYKLKRS